MAAKQSENPDFLTHSIEIESAECSSSHQNVETGKAGPKLGITTLTASLYKAAVEGKIDAFQEHEKRLDKLVTPNKNTILHIHITARSKKEAPLDFVEKILEMCPDLIWQVNITDETLLHIAARHGHDDIVEFLIRKIKETSHNDQEVGTQFGLFFRRLIKKEMGIGVMLKRTNTAEDTVLHEAVRFNHINVVQRLIEADPDYSYGANAAGETPLYLAVERGYHCIVNIMTAITQAPLAYDGPNGRTALHAAVIRNDPEMTKIILEKQRTLNNKKDKRGWISLHYAAYYGYDSIVTQLLDHDESVAYITNKGKKTALHIAAACGKVNVMKDLISRCPDCIELVDKRGRNVFHFAMESKIYEAIKLVLENPSLSNLINEYNGDGNTPLHQLAALGFHMPDFIDHPKVDKLSFNKQNLNALDITLEKNGFSNTKQEQIMEDLKKNGVREGQRVEVDIKESTREDPSSYDGKGKIKDGDAIVFEGAKVLRADGYDRKGKDEDGDTVANIEEGKDKDNDLRLHFKEAREAYLVVAALIATVSFTAGITVPGGYRNEGGPDEGKAILTRNTAFQAFVITNTLAMMFSSIAVCFHLSIALSKDKEKIESYFIVELQYTVAAMIGMGIAFITGSYAVLPSSSGLAIADCVLGCFFIFFLSVCLGEFIADYHGYGLFERISVYLFGEFTAHYHRYGLFEGIVVYLFEGIVDWIRSNWISR